MMNDCESWHEHLSMIYKFSLKSSPSTCPQQSHGGGSFDSIVNSTHQDENDGAISSFLPFLNALLSVAWRGGESELKHNGKFHSYYLPLHFCMPTMGGHRERKNERTCESRKKGQQHKHFVPRSSLIIIVVFGIVKLLLNITQWSSKSMENWKKETSLFCVCCCELLSHGHWAKLDVVAREFLISRCCSAIVSIQFFQGNPVVE